MRRVDEASLALRHRIMRSFADTGNPPVMTAGEVDRLRALADAHVVVLADDDPERIVMAHPFAAHRRGASVASGGRTWWGNCAWDGFGIAAALHLDDAVITDNGVEVRLEAGRLTAPDGALFHVLAPAREWWEDIGGT